LGRDIAKGLKALSKKIVPEDNTPADTVRHKIDEWMRTELSKAEVNHKPPEVSEKYVDKAESLLAVLESAECKDAGQLRRQIDNLFSRENGTVILSTVHKAKGMEWPVVLHLDPWRIPSKWAAKARAEQTPGWERLIDQEMNLRYVCETRTKHTLLMGNLNEFVGQE